MIDLSQVSLDFPCPQCRYEFHETIGWAESHYHTTCPACGKYLRLNSHDLKGALAIARDAIQKFQQNVRSFGQ